MLLPAPVMANPTGGTVISGSAAIGGAGGTLNITQGSDRAVINWQDFSIALGETTNFIQPGSLSAVLNRVLSQNPSELYGTLNATGKVFLINKNGILVGASGVINTQGFVGSTLDVDNAAFMSGGDLLFSGDSEAGIVNLGKIEALDGDVYLIARSIENAGTISAQNSSASLAAGSEVLLSASGGGGLFIQSGSADGLIENSGLIEAASAELKSAGGNEYALAINNTGVIRATGAETIDGHVWLVAEKGTVLSSGEITAVNGANGGEVRILGEYTGLTGSALVDVSGVENGGTVLIGGDYQGGNDAITNALRTYVGSGATIRGDAGENGNGGKIIVWSDEITRFYGGISARGGSLSGDGGLVEVSGKNSLSMSGTVDAGATNGLAGTLLLDPLNIIVQDGGSATLTEVDEFGDVPTTEHTIDPDAITFATNAGTAVTLQANNDITVNSSIITANSGGIGGALLFYAGRHITINASITSDDADISFYLNHAGGADVTANRVAGYANFTNNSLIDAGDGDVSITIGDHEDGGSISTGQITAANLTIANNDSTEDLTSTGQIDLGETEIATNLTITSSANRNVVNSEGTVIVRGTATISVGGDVTINGTNTDFNIIGVTGADIEIYDTNAMRIGTTVATGDYTLTANGPIASYSTQTMTVAGTTTITANNGGFGYADPYISLTNSNDFNTVALDVSSTGETGTGGYAVITDADDIDFSTVTLGSDFTVTSGGAVTDSGVISVASGQTTITAGSANNITLDSTGNNFYQIRIVSGNDVTLYDTNAIEFGNSTGSGHSSISGNLSVTAGGNISQYYGTYYDYSHLTIGGNATFTVTTASSDLLLGPTQSSYYSGYTGCANSIAGSITLVESGSGTYRDVQLRNTNANASVISGMGTGLRNVLFYFDNAASVDLPAMTLSGNLIVDAQNGSLSQSGAIVVDNSAGGYGYSTFRAGTSGNIVLDNASNDFYRLLIRDGYDITLVDTDAIELYANSYIFRVRHDLNVTAGGAITDGSNSAANYYIYANSGTATLNSGTSAITLDSIYNYWGTVAIPAASDVLIYPRTSIVLGNSDITGTLTLDSTNGGSLTQVSGSTITVGSTVSLTDFTSGVTLSEADNVFGDIALSSNTYTVSIRENDAITQASAWYLSSYLPSITLATSNDQAINLGSYSNLLGNLTITQYNTGAGSAGDVSIREAYSDGITQGSAWTTHGNTILNSGSYGITLTNTGNVLGDLQITGGTSSSYPIYIYENDTITDYGAWTIGTATPVYLRAYSGGTLGAGDILLDVTGNILGDLSITATNVTITENESITDGTTAWSTTGDTYLIVANPTSGKTITLDNTSNVLGDLGLGTTGTAGTLASVLITENSDITQCAAWSLGTAPVTLDARANDVIVTTSGNVMGALAITTTNGTPTSVSITEDDAITQASAWVLSGVPVTLYAENDNSITMTQSTNVMGGLIITGGAVSITENDVITQAGAWTTTGTTTLNSTDNSITLTNTGNVLSDIALSGFLNSSPAVIQITENDDITQSSLWNVYTATVLLNATGTDHDVILSLANVLGDLTVTATNATITENAGITDGSAWTVSGTTTLAAGTNDITLDVAGNNFGTMVITNAANATIVDTNAIIFGASTVNTSSGLLTVTAGGEITQSGAITAYSLRLIGTGYATLTNESNNVTNLAAGFSGGDLGYVDADAFAVATLGGTTGINIGANDVTLRSVSGAITGLDSVNASSSSLSVRTGTALELPQMTIAGAQTYTADSGGISLTAGVTSTAAGAITFNSPVTLGAALTIQSSNSSIIFNDTLAGGGYRLTVDAGAGAAEFHDAVSGLGSTASASAALDLTSGGATFYSTLAANNGLAVSGPVVFMDDVTLEDGNSGSVFAGQVTLGKVGGMSLSGYDTLQFNGGLVLQNGPATIVSNGSTLTFTAGVSGAYGLTLDAGTGLISGLNYMGADLTSLTVTAYTPTVPSAGITINGPQTFTATNSSSIYLAGPLTSTASGTGIITFNSPVILSADSTITTADSNIVFSSTVDGAHDLSLSSGDGLKNFTGNVGAITPVGDGIGASIILSGNGLTTFSGTVATRSGITAASAVSFTGNVSMADGDTASTFNGLVTTGGTSISVYDGIAFNAGLTLTDAVSINTNGGALSFGGAVSGTSALTVTLGAGSVSGLNQLQSTLTGFTLNNTVSQSLPAITINGPHIYNGPVSLTGDLTGIGITFNDTATVAADNLELDAGTGVLAVNEAFGLGAYTLTMTGDEIDFSAALSGAGALSLQPSTTSVNVALGGSTATAALDITVTDLSYLPDTLSSLSLGRTDGTGTLSVSAAADLTGQNLLVLNGMGGISQSGALSSGALTLNSDGVVDLSNTGNSLGAITVSGAPTSVSIYDSTDITQAAAWVITAPVTLNAGVGAITLDQTTNTFGTLYLTGGAVTIYEAAATDLGASSASSLTVTSTGAITTSGALTVTGLGSFTTRNDSGADITIASSSTFGSLSALSRNAADSANAGGTIALSPNGSTVIADLATTGNITLSVATGETISQGVSSTLAAAGLELLGSGSFDLSTGTNAITTLAGNTGTLSFTENSGFAIGTVNTVGLTTSGNLTLSTTGTVTQSQAITAPGLELLGTGGIYVLTNTGNAITTLAGDTGTVSLTENSGFAVGTVNTVGMTASGNLTFNTTATVTQDQAIIAAGLELLGAAGVFTLTNTDNAITTLAGNTGTVSLTENSGFAVGTVNTAGLTTSGNLTLSTTAAVTQTQAVSAAGLELLGTDGIYTLTGDTNSLPLIAGNTGSADIHTSGNLVIGTVNTAGFTTNGDLSLTAGGAITQSAALTVGGDLSLTTTYGSGSDVTIDNSGADATITGNTLVGGDYTLTATGDDVSQAADTYLQVAGDLTITAASATLDGAANLIGGSTSTPGTGSVVRQAGVITLPDLNITGDYTVVSTASSRSFATAAINGAAITLDNSGNNVTGAISVTTVAPSITTGADVMTGIQQDTGTSITITGTASFTAESSGAGSTGVVLTNSGNSFGSLRASGNIVNIIESGSTQVASLFGSTSVTLQSGGAITQSGAITTPLLTLNANGSITLTNTANEVTTVNLTSVGAIAYTDASGFAVSGIDAGSGGNTLTLTAGGTGDITQSGSILNVTTLSVTAGGAATLTNTSNAIGALGAITTGGALSLYDSADGLDVDSTITATTGDVTIRTVGDLTLNSGAAVTASSGNIYLSTEGSGNFINSSTAAGSVLSAGTGSRWLIYSQTPDLIGTVHTVKGGLTSSFRLYGSTYTSDAPGTITETGNGFIYSESPALTLTIDAAISGTASHEYGDTPSATVGYVVSGGLADSEDTGDNITFTGTPTYSLSLSSSMDAGSYTIYYTGGLSSAYTLQIGTTGAGYTVTQATLTYVADAASRQYGDANPSLSGSITGFKLSQDTSVLGGTATWTTTADTGSDAGSYAITGSGYTSSNYTFAQAAGNATALTITGRAISITADDQSRAYGDTNPTTGTGTLTSGTLAGTDTLNSTLSVSSTATTASSVGDYPLTPSGATFSSGSSSNYSITYVDGTLSVTARPITITADTQSRYYGDANPTTGTGSITTGSLAGTDALNSALSVSSSAATTDDVGAYALTPSGATFSSGDASNYSITYADGILNITARPITITAATLSRYYGDANPATGTGTVTAGILIGSDSLSTLTVTSPDATTASDVGAYTLTPSDAAFSSGSASNYSITYANGTLNVTARPITVAVADQSRYYGDANPTTGSYTVTSGSLANTDALGGTVSVTSSATTASDVGAYSLTTAEAITFTSGSSSNYAITYTGGTLNVTGRPITIIATDQSRDYGSANPTTSGYSMTSGTLVGSDALDSVTVSTTATIYSNAGDYALTPSGAIFSSGSASNYAITYTDGTLTVDPVPLTIAVDDATRNYGAADPTFTYTATGFVLNDGVSSLTGFNIASAATATSTPGTYAIVATGSSNNYDITFVDGILTITWLTMYVNNQEVTIYGIGDTALSTDTYAVFVDSNNRLMLINYTATGELTPVEQQLSTVTGQEIALGMNVLLNVPLILYGEPVAGAAQIEYGAGPFEGLAHISSYDVPVGGSNSYLFGGGRTAETTEEEL